MDGNNLRKHFEKKYNEYFALAIKVKVHFKQKDVHAMRVTLKKLKAYVEVIGSLTNKKSEKILPVQSIQQVFALAGKLRDIQMNLGILNDRKLSEASRLYYKKTVTAMVKSLTRQIKEAVKPSDIEWKKETHKNLKKMLSAYHGKHVSESCKKYVNKRWAEIDKYMLASDITKSMHQVRINLKNIEAVTELVKHDEMLRVESDRLKGIMQEIGEWHDLAVFADSLKEVNKLAKKKNANEKKELTHLRVKLDEENKSYAKDILRSLRELKKKKNR